MNSPARRAALRHTLTDLSVMAGLGILLAVIGPFGSFELPFAWRLVYWVGLGFGGYACYRPIAGAVLGFGRAIELPEAASWIASAVIATIPMTAIVWAAGQLPGPFRLPSLEAALSLYGYVLAIGGGVCAVFYLLDRGKAASSEQSQSLSVEPGAEPPGAPPARFLDRISPRLGTDLVALEMEDHYLRIHTRLGSELILMRMRDAVGELDGIEGAQVHRSWWVARGAVQAVKRDGRNVRLVLDGGQHVPVARDTAGGLKAAGWF